MVTITCCCKKKNRKIERLLLEIVRVLNAKFKVVDIKFVVGEKGKEENMKIGEQQSYVVFEIDVNGANVNPNLGDTVKVVSSDETIVMLTPDSIVAPGSLASGFATGVKAGTVTLTATASKADGSALGTPKTINVTVDASDNGAVDISFTLNPIVAVP